MTADTSSADTAEEGQREDLESQLGKIADQLSELSAVEEYPSGFRTAASPFDAADVNFESSGWLVNLLQVQAWMYPNAEIALRAAEDNPVETARAFLAAIGAEDAKACVDDVTGIAKLNAVGAEYLAGRLDTAIELQKQYQEWLEASSPKQATEQWVEAWEEVASEIASSEPIKAKSDTWRISDFAGKASRGLLNLNPSYQRGDVWPTRDAQKLIESILRGIPLPSIILLRPASANKQAKYEVVDGKQRLTSILRFVGQHPQALARVKEMARKHPKAKLEELFQSDYKKFRRVWKSTVGEALSDRKEAEYYFPFRLAKNSGAFKGELANLGGKYFHEILEETIHVGESQEAVTDVFQRASDYKIPLIEYLDASPRQVHEVFHLYNRQGKHLNAEEIRNALYHEVDLVKLVLVASGDNKAFKELAPYVPEAEHSVLTGISSTLDGYKFGSARYRRTKLLSWLFALLFEPSERNGELTIRSTAKQIDSLFTSIQRQPGHRLSQRSVLLDVVREAERCLEAHSSVGCWDSRFKDDDKGQKWQELQLVGSLLGVFLLCVTTEEPVKLLEAHRKDLLAFTADHPRPVKTQNKTQWAYIGEVALGILDVVKLDQAQLEARLVSRYGVNCLPTLRAAKKLYRTRASE
jgi:hypothetical protein